MKNLIKVLRYAIPYWGFALLNILFNILSVIFSLVSFAAVVPVLNILFKLDKPMEMRPEFKWNVDAIKDYFYFEIGRLITQYDALTVLAFICATLVVMYFLKNLFRYLAMYYIAEVRNGVVRDIRNALYHKILILPLSFYSEKKKGDIISRMTTDVQEVEWSVMSSLEMMFRDPVYILTYLVTLFILDYELTLMVLVLLPVTGLIIGQIGKSLKRTSAKGQIKMGELLSTIEETISGLRNIKAFNAIDWANRNFRATNYRYNRLMVRLYRKRDLASPLSEFLGIAVSVFVIWYGGKIILEPGSTLDAALFIMYILVFSQIINPVKALSTAIYNIQKGAASVERIEHVLAAEEVITEKQDALPVKEFREKIEYRGVWFRYGQEDVLKNINLIIPRGKSIALVGASGSGKSTMADLLPRFYDTTQGDILIDGVPIRDYIISDVRALMGIVSQETVLFNASVFDNIAFGLQGVTEEQVMEAARVANAHEFIMEMPEGYQTNIGDRGVKMSGGQRQRISIARAVLRNPPIMILDEATSALDTESERLVQEALTNLMQNRTSLVIAHRLSTVQHADEIIVLHKGEIAERGSHNELMALQGVYRRLHDMQALA
ncbi:ABC transporter ATP-binding protein [Lentimicrobium sp.]|uniref:ABC transporter ATP-binding protein n=2 Tax=Lentimicrobium sp. TaxID=2034841 RepID=UPI002B575298|nr:ABC transporter ATP-binding protein [Lentimicrobium sp.]MCO5262047.1 ABC transporter ATP-binding protein/permease [Lentimicrobium sp.]HOP13016.1 ABC transporter ATP-binding protein [Lentimicrobium sp.]HPJ61611.1 ABC transporter ATP-binding protein [Lentimicrobium sp.]HRW68517.1 ABC transporter ATP-binding protein [Lentimicrobium sp.]